MKYFRLKPLELAEKLDRELLLDELQAAQDHLAKCAAAIVRADHSLAHLMYQTGMQIKTLLERLENSEKRNLHKPR